MKDRLSATATASQRMLFHVSEEPGIERFAPRLSTIADEPVVWAIDERHLQNYLLPRACPRVTFSAGPRTTPGDRARFLGDAPAVVAIESGWIERVQRTRLYCYQLPAASFRCVDAGAGYFVSRELIAPIAVEVIIDPQTELERRGVELRILNDLWSLHDIIAASSLSFSMIRMRNARPRQAAGAGDRPRALE